MAGSYLDAPNAQGKIVNWALEIPNPFVVQQNGFSRDILRATHEVR
jgi:hypothetical protein